MNRVSALKTLFTLFCLLFATTGIALQDSGESVLTSGVVTEDLYVAGGSVDVVAEVEGDVVAAGGRVMVDGQVTGDVIAAGGSVTVHGRVDDDVRLAGGSVVISATIGDGVVAAGGNLLLAPGTTVGGDAMLSGGRVTLAGRVRGTVKMAGGQLIITGQVDGDLELAGQSIEIGPDAQILGTVTYHSPQPAEIDPKARIEGSVSYTPIPLPSKEAVGSGLAVAGVLLWLSVALTGVVLYLLFPREMLSIANTIAKERWKTLGLGLAVFSATPVVAVMLVSTGLGWLLAWLLMTVYCLLLLVGFLSGILLVGNAGLRRLRHGREPSKLGVSLAIMLALLGVMLIGLIPLIGWLLAFMLLLFGVGGIVLQAFRCRRTTAT